VRGGVIERCGHWIAEERPDFKISFKRTALKVIERHSAILPSNSEVFLRFASSP
jgi:hypothetical protein